MSFDLLACRTSLVKSVDEAWQYYQEEVPLPRDPGFQERVALGIEASGWRRFNVDPSEVAAATGMSLAEVEASFTGIELNLEEPPLQVHVTPYGRLFHLPWGGPEDQAEVVSPVWAAFESALDVEPLLLIDPQGERALGQEEQLLAAAYGRASAQVLELMASPDFAEQVKRATEEHH